MLVERQGASLVTFVDSEAPPIGVAEERHGSERKMASKFVEVTGPRGIDQMLELVTITCQNDIRGAATNLAEIVAEGGMKAAICDDISKK